MRETLRPIRVCCHVRSFANVFLATFWLSGAVAAVADYTIEYEIVARSGVTPIPGGHGAFIGFGNVPAIDEWGNVVFTGAGNNDPSGRYQSGVYTHIGVCCQHVADRNTLVPGGGGITFDNFSGDDRPHIEDGRVAFVGDIAPVGLALGVYSNVGQPTADDLYEVVNIIFGEWSEIGYPWVDGDTVAMWGVRTLPTVHAAILLRDGVYGNEEYLDPGSGYSIAYDSQVSISGDAAVVRRYSSSASQLVISHGGIIEVLAQVQATPMPGANGGVFHNFSFLPSVDRDGLDVAFSGNGSTGRGVYKRANGGPLQEVADQTTIIPGTANWVFSYFGNDETSVANGQVTFIGYGPLFTTGIYTDIGGELWSIADNLSGSTIQLNGSPVQLTDVFLGNKSLAYTGDGYVVAFWAALQSGGTAIIRATITDAQASADQFTVHKNFSDNNTASVSVSLSCTSGTVTDSPQPASESTPAVFTITGASAGATCTAIENPIPSGYTRNQTDCQNGDPLNGSCTIVNTLNSTSNSFTVHKNFSDNNTSWVSITLSCSSGTVTTNPIWAREGTPAVFNITGAAPGTTCTAVESSVPAGYTKNESDCQNGDPLNGSCTIVNTVTSASNTFTVFKDFSDVNAASVSVSAVCTSGTVTNNPQQASEASPAVFTVSGASAGATCTATESAVPAGYVANQADCQSGRPLNGSCILVNTRLPSGQLQDVVYDGFEDGNANGWSTSGTVDVAGGTAIGQYALRKRKSSSAVLAVSTSGYSGVTIEMRVAGSSLENGDACYAEYSTNGGSTWTTLVLVDNGDPDGTFFTGSASPAAASNNANLRLRFRSTGAQPNDYCWGDEARVRGTASAGSAGSFIVRKDFSDDNASSVSVSLACSSGTVTNSPRNASESAPAIFYIQGQSGGASCSATENPVPAGYTVSQSGCQDGDPVNGACTIVNTVGQTTNGTFTVYKNFSDNSAATVTFTATCSSGTVTNSPRQATESSPAVFTITGASAGTTCTAAEPTVPSGYTRDQSNCQSAKPLNGSCTIVNTLNNPPQEVDILYSTFEDGQSGGWSMGANVAVDSALAIGQYALQLQDDGAVSTRPISTAGYTDVDVTVRMAATSLEGSDVCLAEYSTNGGGTWSTLLELSNGSANGTFATATTSTASASNNPNFRLRFRMLGKGKGDHCHGDEVRVRGVP